MSLNNYSSITLPDTFQHSTIQKLYFNENQITDWAELSKFSHAFPSLRTLIASSNPIQEIPELKPGLFPSLHTLNLNNCGLCSWDSLEHLSTLSKLEELSVMKVPLGEDMDEKKRRKAFVAHLPNIVMLNKSVVSAEEREIAERWFIRDLADRPDPPAIYHTLVEKHKITTKLADVKLNPPKTITFEFHFDGEDRPMEKREFPLKSTVGQLRSWVGENLLSMPTSSFRLYYNDRSWFSMDVFTRTHNNRYLHSYRFSEETEIHIEMV